MKITYQYLICRDIAMNDILVKTGLRPSGWSQWSVLLRKPVFFGKVETRNTTILVNHNYFFFWMVCAWTG